MIDELKKAITLEGELFCLVEEGEEGDINICAEVAGVNIWNLLKQNDKERIRIKIEVLGKENEEKRNN